MDLKRLHHLVCLADEAHFGRAAQRAHLSQPAFSRSIQAAEHEMGLKLFDRGATEATCTPSGAFVVERARRLLQDSRQMESDVDMFRERAIGDISFGVGPMPAATLLPELIRDVRERFPGVTLRVKINSPHHLLGSVLNGEHDFFVGDTREVPQGGKLAVRPIGRQPGGFYARSGHPLFRQASVRLSDIVPYGMAASRLPADICVMLLRGMGLPEDGKLPVALECDDAQLLKRVALATDTLMVGTDDILRQEIEAGTMRALHPVDFPQAYSQLGVVSRQGRTHSPMAQYAIDFLARLAADATPPGAA